MSSSTMINPAKTVSCTPVRNVRVALDDKSPVNWTLILDTLIENIIIIINLDIIIIIVINLDIIIIIIIIVINLDIIIIIVINLDDKSPVNRTLIPSTLIENIGNTVTDFSSTFSFLNHNQMRHKLLITLAEIDMQSVNMQI